ncbi:MAG: hypothetical protein ACI32E_01335 [Bacilli bacterium]
MKKSKTFYTIGSIILLGLIIITTLVIVGLTFKKPSGIHAETEDAYIITVEKTSTVKVYVSGVGVKDITNSETDYSLEKYSVEKGTEVTLRAINQSRIFESWNISPSVGTVDLNSSYIYFTPTSDLTISVNRRDPLNADYGNYLTDPISIKTKEDIEYLQTIFRAGTIASNITSNVIKCYDNFFNKYDSYVTSTDKVSDIVTTFFYKLQYGYYHLAASFSFFEDDFYGIGTADFPFKGVFNGQTDNDTETIAITTTCDELTGDNYSGLFGVTSEEAVITDLCVSYAVTFNAGSAATNIYVGGIAGKCVGSYLNNLVVTTSAGIENTTNADIYVGGVAGIMMNGSTSVYGIDYDANISCKVVDKLWSMQNAKTTSSTMCAGTISGSATNVYVNNFNVDVSNFSMISRFVKTDSYNVTNNSYLGNIFGYYTNTKRTRIANILISGTRCESIISLISSGNAYVGGLIGYVNVGANLELGKINFQINEKNSANVNEIKAQSLSSSSQANLYAAGLFASMSQNSINKIVGLSDFNDCIVEYEVSGVKKTTFEPIFVGNFEIDSLQKGKSNGTYGKSIAAGLVANGYVNMNGTSNEDRSNIIITSKDYTFDVSAVQTTTSTTLSGTYSNIDKAHCTAGLVYGMFGTDDNNITINNINIFIDNANLITTREVGATSNGDLHTGGFVGYSYEVDYNNINFIINNATIKSQSYSNDVIANTNEDANNVYTGAFIAECTCASSGSTSVNNILVTGYDYDKKAYAGTDVQMEATQNSQNGGGDYKNENYIGGVIGKLRYANVTGLTFEGNIKKDSYIRLQSDKSPDTSFCGGVIGYIKNTGDITTTVSDCEIKNAKIEAITTVTSTAIGNPDMYAAGIVGGCFNGGTYGYGSTLNINNCRTYNTEVTSIGNEIIAVYAAGILAINTWSGYTNISDCYVYGCKINAYEYATSSTDSGKVGTFASGIMGENLSNGTINNCGVFDTSINAFTECSFASFGGHGASSASIVAFCHATTNISGCYSNASCSATGNNSVVYGIASSSNTKNYYCTNRVTAGEWTSTGLSLDTITLSNNETVYLFSDALTDTDDYSAKLYPVFESGKFTVNYNTSSAVTIQKSSGVTASDILDIWVNVKSGGDASNPMSYATDEARHKAGWFLYGKVIVTSGGSSGDDFILDEVTYPNASTGEEFTYVTDNQFKNINSPYNVNSYIGYEPNESKKDENILSYHVVKLYDGMPSIRFKFTITGTNASLYYPIFYDESNNVIDFKATSDYGTYDMTVENNASSSSYVLTYHLNTNLNKSMLLTIGFGYGTSGQSAKVFRLELVPNVIELSGFEYAEYTPPTNYSDSTNLGTVSNPWIISTNRTVKILPVITKSNDPLVDDKKVEYHSESNIQYVTYTLDSNASGYASLNSSGELTIGSSTSDSVYTVTLTLRSNTSSSVTMYFKIGSVYMVTYKGIGTNLSGLLYVTMGQKNDYLLKCPIQSGYGGLPVRFNVTIGSTTYDYNQVISKGWIRDENNLVVNAWDINYEYFNLLINKDAITGNIDIDIEFCVVYELTFNAQNKLFKQGSNDNDTLTFKIPSFYSIDNVSYAMTFDYFFNTQKVVVDGKQYTNYEFLKKWIEELTIFGYINRDFYLIDDANAISSYGISFSEIVSRNIVLNTSYTFYARWSFILELIEAPGTHIKTSFQEDFMEDYGVDENGFELSKEELEKLNLNRAISIPINSNRGYTFTIEKDADFIGEADVAAYIYMKNGSEEELKRITIEKYHDNMYIYYIPPESITGYLIICTSVSNSDFIVGDNTSSVTDTILPEDGIFTFKYIANHFNKEDSISYIYNSGNKDNALSNLSLYRDIIIQFYQQTYNEDGSEIVLNPIQLVENTIVQVYYHQYINGTLQDDKTIVGTYIVRKDEEGNLPSELFLSDFKKLNYNESAFPHITFNELLGGLTNLSEEYFFSITPPNGYTIFGDGRQSEIVNNVVHVGYYDSTKRPASATEEEKQSENYLNPYVTGVRTEQELANIPLEPEEGTEGIASIINQTTKESSLNSQVFSVIPSRQTTLEANSQTQYTFMDKTDYSIFSLTIHNQYNFSKTDGFIYFNTDTTLESSFISFGMSQISLTLGYGTGEVKVYGKHQNGSYEEIGIINVDSVDYKKYTINVNPTKEYQYFKIVNSSPNLMLIKDLSFASGNNGMLYEINADDFKNSKLDYSADNVDATLTIVRNIVGDTRHDGKKFVLAVQIEDASGNIVTDVSSLVSINVSINKTNHLYNPYEPYTGKNTAYFDLSKILESYDVNSFDFVINVSSGYTVKSVLLLETVSVQKPAMAEVRVLYTY